MCLRGAKAQTYWGVFYIPQKQLCKQLNKYKPSIHTFLSFPGSSVGNESTCNARDPGSIPGLGRSAGEGISYSLHYSWASLVAQLVKKPPAMWVNLWVDPRFNLWVGKIPWRRERLPTPVSWHGECHGLHSLCGCKGSDVTVWLSLSHSYILVNSIDKLVQGTWGRFLLLTA